MDWETLRSSCLACTRCELCKTRTNVVFGQGVEDAEVLFVGEGPGQNEDEQGLPFVGRSGQLLDKYLFAIDLDRTKNCYIANIPWDNGLNAIIPFFLSAAACFRPFVSMVRLKILYLF